MMRPPPFTTLVLVCTRPGDYNNGMSDRTITLEQVRHVAKLARLALTEEELQRLTPQLEAIFAYIDKLSHLDVSEVEPMARAVPMHNVLREDVPGPALPVEQVLQNAPQTDGRFFKVPKVIGADEDSAG